MRAFHRRPIKTRIYALIGLEFLFGIAYGTFSLTLPLRAESIVANLALLGIIFALPEIFGTFVDIPIGEFAKRFGRRRTIFYSGLLLAASSLLFISLRNPILFLATLLFYEVATQSFIIPADAEGTALSPARNTGRINGLLEGFHNLGYSIGPVAAGFVIGFSLAYAFLIALAVAIAMMIVSFLFMPKEHVHEEFAKAAAHVITRDKVFKAGFAEFGRLGFEGVFVAFIFFAFALHWGFIALMEPLYTKALGVSDFEIGLIYAGFTLPIFFVSLIVGRYLDRRSAKGITVAGLLLHALAAFGFSATGNPQLLFVLALVSGVGDALILPAVYTMFDRLSSYHSKEHVSGVKILGESFGYFAGPLAGGLLSDAIGFRPTFFALGVFLLAFTAVTLFVRLKAAEPVLSVS